MHFCTLAAAYVKCWWGGRRQQQTDIREDIPDLCDDLLVIMEDLMQVTQQSRLEHKVEQEYLG